MENISFKLQKYFRTLMLLLYVISAALVSIRHVYNDLKDSVLCIVYVYSLFIFVPVHEVWNPDQLFLGLEDHHILQETSPCPESQYNELHYQKMDTHVPFSSPEGGVGGLGQISPPEGATAVYQPDGEGVGHQGSIPMPKLGRWILRSSHIHINYWCLITHTTLFLFICFPHRDVFSD